MSTANQHDTHDPDSLLYYAPRRLRDGAKALQSIRPRPEDGAQSIPIAFLERLDTAALGERTQDTAPPPSPFPETLRSLESEAIVSLRLLSQRAQKPDICCLYPLCRSRRHRRRDSVSLRREFYRIARAGAARQNRRHIRRGGAAIGNGAYGSAAAKTAVTECCRRRR